MANALVAGDALPAGGGVVTMRKKMKIEAQRGAPPRRQGLARPLLEGVAAAAIGPRTMAAHPQPPAFRGGGTLQETTMSTMQARATLKVKTSKTVSVQARAKAFVAGIEANSTQFASLAANATAIQNQSTALDKAETLAGTKAKGTAAARNVQRKALVGMLKTVLPLVQAIADASGTLEGSVAAIEAAGLAVALVPKRIKPILAVTQPVQGGSVVLGANATALGAAGRKKTFFNWQATPDGKTWITLPPTPKCKTSVANLTPLTSYGFRVAVTNSSGIMGEWSPVVSFLVH
jgi:hypothetical protein